MEKQLRVLMIGAHLDDNDFCGGGTALKYLQLGHKVRFLSVCNGSGGHHVMSPAETAIIAGDIAIKASGSDLGFVDRFSGTLIITGTVSSVQSALDAVCEYCENTLHFTVCPITKT